MERDIFLNLPAEKIVDLVRQKGRPRVGIFVPDGNRRLVLATTDLQENTDEFFNKLIFQQTSAYLKILEIFFSHGLEVLFVPLFSHSVLTRSVSYKQSVVLETIKFIFTNEECLDFYVNWDIRIKVYGNLSALNETVFSQAIDWIEELQESTRNHSSHTFFIGIGGEPVVGDDTAKAAIQFYKKYQREPSKDDLIEFIYGPLVSSADFFIMSSKFAGLGALPGLVCGHDTKVYYLLAPGIMALTKQTYRSILFDLLYVPQKVAGKDDHDLSSAERNRLNAWYIQNKNKVIGLGQKIGSVWVPNT